MATSSFFYGGSSAPEQNTVDELIDSLNAKVAAADEDRVVAEQAATMAQDAANNAALSESNVADLAAQAQATLTEANTAVAAAEAAVAVTTTNAATATTKAAEASASAAAAATSATSSATSAAASSTSATAASGSATSASGSATTATTQASNAAASATAAAGSATTATTQATNASTSATAAAGSASAASTSATNAASSASAASTSATASAGSATAASTSATAASGSATTASTAATAAQAAQAAAEAAYDNFDDRYLGAKTSAPTVDNDGNALVTGALYFNSSLGQMYVWSGSAWGIIGSNPDSVVGPASSTDNAIARFDGTMGKLVQNSGAFVDDSGFMYAERVFSKDVNSLIWGGIDTAGVFVAGGGSLGFSASSINYTGDTDLRLSRDGADLLAQRRGTNPQTFRLYNTYTDGSNYERGFMRWNTNVLEIGAEAAGTGTQRAARVNLDASSYITNSGLVWSPGNYVTFSMGGTANQSREFRVESNNSPKVVLGSAMQLGWNNGATASSNDTGLARDSAGVVRVSNGSTGTGSLKAANIEYSGTLTGGTGVVNFGSGQFYKDASGNVGIGTSSPATLLEVKGTAPSVNVNGTTSASFRGYSIRSNGTEIASMLAEASGGENRITAGFSGFGGFQTFYTNGAERARIDSSGNLLVSTSSYATTPYNGMTVQAGNNTSVNIGHALGASSGFLFVNFGYNAGQIGSITQNGTTGVTYNTSSDYRLKEAVEPLQNALARNALLNPVKYKWKIDGSEGEGFIAHELQGPFPAAVTGEKDAVDSEGQPIYQGIGTGPLDGHFAACVNELQAIIQSLTARVIALEGASDANT